MTRDICEGCSHYRHMKMYHTSTFWCTVDREYPVPVDGGNRVGSNCARLQTYATIAAVREL